VEKSNQQELGFGFIFDTHSSLTQTLKQ
jgi:hypothetical protein